MKLEKVATATRCNLLEAARTPVAPAAV